jgi:hypothetical protein
MDMGDIVHATLGIKDVEIVIFHGIKCNTFSRITLEFFSTLKTLNP